MAESKAKVKVVESQHDTKSIASKQEIKSSLSQQGAIMTEVKEDDESSTTSESTAIGEQEEEMGQIGKGVATGAISISREEYLLALKDINAEYKQLQIKNNILHRRLAEYYKKRKLEHVLKPFEGAADLEEKYQQKLVSYLELKEKAERETADIWSKVEVVENLYKNKNDNANKKFADLQSMERSTGTGLIYSRKGKPIAEKTVTRFLTLQRRKAEQSSALCLRYIRARNAVAELEAIVKKLETLGPGLYVYQYEQLNIDYHNYMAKIEEREDELIKNRAKCTEHNQILAHIREKMHHTDEVIDFAECDLGESEIDYSRAREDLGTVKARRNKLRWLLEGERQKAGLLTKKDLLRDFQEATDKVVTLRKKKESLENQIAGLAEQLKEARKSISYI